MKKTGLLIIILFIIIPDLIAQTYINGGDVNGIWTKSNSPYYINGEISIPNHDTLVVEPGVKIIFMGHYKFIIRGILRANGTPQDTIVFTAQDHTVGWHGIRIIENYNDTTVLEYCKLEYGKANTGTGEEDRCGGALYYKIGKLRISNCLFQYNLSYHPNAAFTGGGALALTVGSPVVENCEFFQNTSNFGAGIIIWYETSTPLIRNNYFHDNDGHGLINIGSGASPTLVNNYMRYNFFTDHGLIHFSNGSGKAVFINNTIVLNTGWGGAIFENDNSDPIFINNIIWGNEPAQVNLLASSGLSFINCIMQGGTEGFVGGNYFMGLYQNCIDADPEFENAEVCIIKNNSPCIGVGIDSIELDGEWYYTPENDIYGNSRPNPAGSLPDIGAFESPLALPVRVINITNNPTPEDFRLFQNYPNPLNSFTIINYQLTMNNFVTLKVYNTLSEEVITLVNEQKPAGTYKIEFYAGNLPSGIYFYRIQAGPFTETKKMILLK